MAFAAILPKGDTWADSLRWSVKYGMGFDVVHITSKPSDCDWSRAPLGDKACHFEPAVTAYNATGYPVAIDAVPTYQQAAGKTLVSFDSGKTWATSHSYGPMDLTVKMVAVRWKRVAEN